MLHMYNATYLVEHTPSDFVVLFHDVWWWAPNDADSFFIRGIAQITQQNI